MREPLGIAVMTRTALRGTDKLVALSIAMYYNPSWGYAQVSTKRLAAACGMSTASVSRAISRLRDSGVFVIEDRGGSNRFTPQWDQFEQVSAPRNPSEL